MPNSTASDKSLSYIPTLDGWRAIAILWVLIGHAQPSIIRTHILTTLGSFDGVYLFFALSGFLICTRLLREEAATGTISLKSFYMRRLFRIQPAALTYLLVISLLGLAHVIALRWLGVVSATLMLRNFFPALTLGLREWYSAHFWSLAVEEHFYLLFPLTLALIPRRRLGTLTAAVILLEIWHTIVGQHAALQRGIGYIQFRTDMAINFILVGCVFAVALTHVRLAQFLERWLCPWVAVTFATLLFTLRSLRFPDLRHALLIVVFPLLIVSTSLHPKSLSGQILELPPLRFLGRISYSLYLWQQLFVFPAVLPASDTLHSHIFLCWAATFACALASYYLVERPCIPLGHRLTSHRLMTPGYKPFLTAASPEFETLNPEP